MDDPLEAMINKVSADPSARIASADVLAWAGSLSNWDFYNTISLRIAQRYQAGTLSYRVCDHLMNDLWQAVTDSFAADRVNELPYPFFDIYEAFDAGEFHRKADKSDDPVATYTTPMIRDLLLEYAPADSESGTDASPNKVDR